MQIVLLNDGDTYSDITGCKVMELTEAGERFLEDGGSPKELSVEHVKCSAACIAARENE